jgi:hypothetical protein
VDLYCFDGHLVPTAGEMIIAVVTQTNVTIENAIEISPPCRFLMNQCAFELRSFPVVGELVEYSAIEERYDRTYQTNPTLF